MGKVFLVGAGPGDPDLITVKGQKAIEKADVILYDRLVNPELLGYASLTAKLIYCGKDPNHQSISQADTNQMLVDLAQEGHTVTRLKGGDPFIYGRGGEEAEILARYSIPFEIVPGITAGIAAPAYAGIPVTHRDYSSSVAFVSGVINKDIDKDEYWKHLALGPETLCIYMGVKKLPKIVELLTQNGRDQKTPIALVHMGTSQLQKTVVGTLETIIDEAKEIENPAMIIVGEVVKLRNRISWFEATYKNELLTQLTYQ
ncbi:MULTISPECIES: uroporphyrinogen-III C-methyltransferase [Staphylococcus]|jgi:uroporphyrin-III C-methyltransferase|uniref:Uroporphyrinogen-III C-methyltransferase n=1 Tax=Staphylococcus nepalensis TaxID=214473 RepID=A0A291JNR7_9STAP|nr:MULTISPECIES: uroporphyrinogen-III C-methyltransferase [Staphylococcus]VDG68278.1 uroporphyrinogen III synthase/methyltransferase [Lacrimispora indolis]ATH61235.1 uroporphyrinogen-III C-methyltransferase [Staphylococcus nepalensis]ATH66266.1 uroporphyrinogen-III C-methyltransferase [Staphylococcus nepalensis]AWI45654.1 uroporphyrinogen-III C-methyltransferase [Staphylococcus nepalensis]MBO1206039.1 uroporphyrinogen-III C-methyltransferase [Staphylococcus nepalensis]